MLDSGSSKLHMLFMTKLLSIVQHSDFSSTKNKKQKTNIAKGVETVSA